MCYYKCFFHYLQILSLTLGILETQNFYINLVYCNVALIAYQSQKITFLLIFEIFYIIMSSLNKDTFISFLFFCLHTSNHLILLFFWIFYIDNVMRKINFIYTYILFLYIYFYLYTYTDYIYTSIYLYLYSYTFYFLVLLHLLVLPA